MAKKDYDYLFKILMTGNTGVGKRSLLSTFADEVGNTSSINAVGIDFKVKTIEVNGKKIKLQIWLTAGSERLHTVSHGYYSGASGIMLIYDITNAQSVKDLPKWMEDIKENGGENLEIMILGNKSDLEDKRQVVKLECRQFAEFHHAQLMEASAMDRNSINLAFHRLAEAILNRILAEKNNQTMKSRVLGAITGFFNKLKKN